MAMKVVYTVFDGEVVSENRNGTERDYVPDPLGSTVALLDGSQSQTDTFTYWPYGEVQARTGSTATPFQFVGTLGYYRDSSARAYVRARYYQQVYGRWMTQVPEVQYLKIEHPYSYCGDVPVHYVDPAGLQYEWPSQDDLLRDYMNRAFPPGYGIPDEWFIPPDWKQRIREAPGAVARTVRDAFKVFEGGYPFPWWEYGNCCGYYKRCCEDSTTFTCADEACKQHDVCLNKWDILLAVSCNCRFCNDLQYCWNIHCSKRPVDKRQCNAIWEMSWFFCPTCGRSGAPRKQPSTWA